LLLTAQQNNYYSHRINHLNHSFHMWKNRFPPPACYFSAGSPPRSNSPVQRAIFIEAQRAKARFARFDSTRRQK
jgi:hypothetical protein